MKRLLPYVAVVIGVLGLGVTGASAHSNTNRLASAVDDYKEECTHEGCSTEEVRELYASYKEECLHEGCSYEEVRELGGSEQGAIDMLHDFQQRRWTVDSDDFPHCHDYVLGSISTTMPTTPGTMNCKVVFLLTTKCKGRAADGHTDSWTIYGFSGVPTTARRCR